MFKLIPTTRILSPRAIFSRRAGYATATLNLELISKIPNSKVGSYPIVFVPGGFHGAFCWELFQQYFDEHGRENHALSIRGHGNSPGKDKIHDLTLDDCVQDIKSVVDHVRTTSKKDKVILVGHSAGGGMSQKYTSKYPESIAALITLGAFPPSGGIKAFINWTINQPRATFMSVIKNDPKLTLGSAKIYKEVMFSPQMDEKIVEKYFPMLDPAESRKLPLAMNFRFVDIKKAQENPAYKKLLDDKNVLVIGGDDDILFPPDAVKGAAKEYGAEAKIFEGVGHNLMMDTKWPEVAKYIENWLNSKNL